MPCLFMDSKIGAGPSPLPPPSLHKPSTLPRGKSAGRNEFFHGRGRNEFPSPVLIIGLLVATTGFLIRDQSEDFLWLQRLEISAVLFALKALPSLASA